MTFGQLLKQMLVISDLRASFLANQLGYDNSYISRWLSGQKLPSLKYNDDLFQRIAVILVQNMDDESRAVMIREMLPEQPSDMDAQNFTNQLSKLLSNAYYSSDTQKTDQFMLRSDNRNASIAVLSQQSVYRLFYDSMDYLSKTALSPYINMIVNAPPHFHVNEEFQVIRNAPSGDGDRIGEIVSLPFHTT